MFDKTIANLDIRIILNLWDIQKEWRGFSPQIVLRLVMSLCGRGSMYTVYRKADRRCVTVTGAAHAALAHRSHPLEERLCGATHGNFRFNVWIFVFCYHYWHLFAFYIYSILLYDFVVLILIRLHCEYSLHCRVIIHHSSIRPCGIGDTCV